MDKYLPFSDKELNDDLKDKRIAKLEAAAQERLKHGHNDTCDSRLTDGQKCSCGQDALAKALREEE